MIKVGVIYGGKSTEHDVSIISGNSIINSLNKNKYDIYHIYIDKDGTFFDNLDSKVDNVCEFLKKMDVIFPIVHGKYGEDGTIQGMLELLNVPYVGCGVFASAAGMDKVYSKILFERAGIKTAKWFYLKKVNDNYIYVDKEFNECVISNDELDKYIVDNLNYPVIVKPSSSGSSVGVSMVKSKDDLKHCIDFAFSFDDKVLIEECIIGKEVECAVLGKNHVKASTPGEIIPDEDFYSYDSKYKNNKSKIIIPASISNEVSNKIKNLAIKAFKAIDGKGLSRVDFFVNGDNIYINEINTLPGFTDISMYSKLWEYDGLKFGKLLDELILFVIK